MCLPRQVYTYVQGLVVDITALNCCGCYKGLPVDAHVCRDQFLTVRWHWRAGGPITPPESQRAGGGVWPHGPTPPNGLPA